MKTNRISGNVSPQKILARTELIIQPDEFVLTGLNPDQRHRLENDLVNGGHNFFQYTVEPDVLTLLISGSAWEPISHHYPDAMVQGPLRIFTFSVAMDWDVVGFLAAVTGVLAEAGVPLGAVCGYYRDHLFIAVEYADRAEAVLRAKIEQARA